MKDEKKQKLEAAGWRVGSAADFLELNDEERALIGLKLQLARWISNRRAQARWTQVEFARRIGSSQSRVAKMEAGDPSVSLDLLFRSALAAGATPKELGRVVAGNAPAHARRKSRG